MAAHGVRGAVGRAPGAVVVFVFLTWNETGSDVTFTALRLRRAAQRAATSSAGQSDAAHAPG